MVRVVKIELKGVNAYLVISPTYRLLVDCGFPGSVPEIGRQLRPHGLMVRDVDGLVVTHFHIDHAGVVQELKNEGISFLLMDVQHEYITAMEDMMVGKWPYRRLTRGDNMVMTTAEAGKFITGSGIAAQVLHTPGHSADSVSLLLSSGEVFTGDLPHPDLSVGNEMAMASWQTLRSNGTQQVFPGHGDSYML